MADADARDDLKVSIVIPYKQRLDTLKVVFAALADQTMDMAQFQVIVGVMEYSPEYLKLCRRFTDKLNVISVLTTEEWNVSRARNLALAHVSGRVTLIMDADIAVPATFLDDLYDRYFAAGREVCVIGQPVNYGSRLALDKPEVRPYSHYRQRLADLATARGLRKDPRWQPETLPLIWSAVWTGLVALPTGSVRRHSLLFDEGFRGWGVEDQEWGYRIAAAGIPIVRGTDVYGLHLPHVRDNAANDVASLRNLRHFLRKWPELGVELVVALKWSGANPVYHEVSRNLDEVVAAAGHHLGVARGRINGVDTLLIGAPVEGGPVSGDSNPGDHFDDGAPEEALPLIGFALPYPDRSIDACRVLPPILALSPPYREAVLREAHRVCTRIVAPVAG